MSFTYVHVGGGAWIFNIPGDATKERHLVNQPLHRASGAHGEVVTQVSCHSDAVMWRYATLPVWNEISRKLLFNNLSSV